MNKPAKVISCTIEENGVLLSGVHRTDRGTKYLGNTLRVLSTDKSEAEYKANFVQAVEVLLSGNEVV